MKSYALLAAGVLALLGADPLQNERILDSLLRGQHRNQIVGLEDETQAAAPDGGQRIVRQLRDIFTAQ